jgi:hypothetical protein
MDLTINSPIQLLDNKASSIIEADRQFCLCNPTTRNRVQRMLTTSWQLSISSQNTTNSWSGTFIKLCDRIINVPINLVSWIKETHCGISKLVGARLISAQFNAGHTQQQSQEIIDTVCNTKQPDGYRSEKISMGYGSVNLTGVICYPPSWNENENSDCILFHNPNGHVISQFFSDNKLATTPEDQDDGLITDTPGNLQKGKKYPIILYDYRGTGINKPEGIWRYLPTATAETAIQDGITALHYALTNFSGNITILGSSMGGGIATISLANYLDATNDSKNIESRVNLISHDSYTTTSCVMIPQYPSFANNVGSLLKSHIDAEESMQCLSHRNVKIIVLAHEKDDIIPKEARMSRFLPKSDNISSYTSERSGHANLSKDQLVVINNKTEQSLEDFFT